MLLGIGVKNEIHYSPQSDESLSPPTSDLQAHGMSNALKIGGNVLQSVPACKQAFWGSWEKPYFKSTWRNVSAMKICHYQISQLLSSQIFMLRMFFLSFFFCEWNFAEDSEINFRY